MLNMSEIICLKVSEMAIAGFCHRNRNGVEFVRIFLLDNVRNMLENVRNFSYVKKGSIKPENVRNMVFWMLITLPKYRRTSD